MNDGSTHSSGESQVFDVEKAGEEYDYFMDRFGSPPPVGLGRFDRRVLIPRPQVPEWVERDSNEPVSLEELDVLEGEGIFSWLRGAGDGRDLGVPVYVPYRIGLCRKLRRDGWTREEILELVEWEEWTVTDMVEGDLPYEDDDRLIVLREFRERLQMLESERVARLPAAERPHGWMPTGWTSDIKAMPDRELGSELAEQTAAVGRLESVTPATASPKLQREIGRRAYQLRVRYEGVRLLSVVEDRTRYEAGFSPHVQFEGRRQLIGDPENIETFGIVDWHETLQSWRIMNDPDRAPIRLPGVVCVGGVVQMPNAVAPEVYSKCFEVFRLAEYPDRFAELVGDRRCQHCHKPLPKTASERRLYCDSKCSQANRQRRHRMREKEAILRRRGGHAS